MRIALVAEGSRGDVHPMFELAARLVRAGHRVRLCAPPDFAADAAERGISFVPVGGSLRDYLAAHASALIGATPRAVIEAGRYLAACLDAQFACLPQATAGAERIVAASLSLAAASCAELHGIPYRFILYCPALIPSAEHPSVVVTHQSLPRLLNRISWSLSAPLLDAFLRRLVNRHRVRLGLRPVEDGWRYLMTERPILAADRALAPAPADAPVAVRQVPCLHSMHEAPLPAKLEGFLEEGPPPVYVGFGSMPDPDAAATTRLVLEAAAGVGARLLIGAGWAALGEGALPEGTLAISSVAHAALFRRVAAVVHHAGAGTTTTAARAGVPQIAVPHFGDQHYWGRRVERLGLGPPPIRRRSLTRERLAEALDAVLGNELLAERAAAFGERLRAEASELDPVDSVLS